jgi:hypothetical protein
MFMAAALALAELSSTKIDANAPLLPPIDRLRGVAAAVARGVWPVRPRKMVLPRNGKIGFYIILQADGILGYRMEITSTPSQRSRLCFHR